MSFNFCSCTIPHPNDVGYKVVCLTCGFPLNLGWGRALDDQDIETNVEVLVDADISNPPEDVDWVSVPVLYKTVDPNASWNLPK